jgi:hypothetical protein
MRTTIEFSEDTAAAIEQYRKATGAGISEAVNELIRRGLLPREARPPFRQETRRLGLRIDVSNVAEALEVLEGPANR